MKYLAIAILAAACGAHTGARADAGGGADGGGGDGSSELQCDPNGGNTCNGSDVVTCNSDGTYGSVVQTCADGFACTAGTCQTACTADGVDLVYVVDEQNDFMSFDPRLLPGNPFTKIGTLACPTMGASIQSGNSMVMPFSMSVDRDGVAWVLYTSGELFNVSLVDASCTAANNTVGASGMELFGMGFSTDTVGGMTEKLFLAGGGNGAQANGQLAYDDTHGGNLTPSVLGTLTAQSDYSPELTGTSEAKLYGFYPEVTTNTPAYVQEIDKTSGAPTGMVWNLGTGPLDTVRDWAFAQWGGVFWVFVTTTDTGGNNPNSTVRSIDRMSGTYTNVLQNLPYNIDGAGVSTCAPTVIQ
ncbi:MAG TPA: hypothetical protein VGF94_05905 [Kofleriaceae bacterium]